MRTETNKIKIKKMHKHLVMLKVDFNVFYFIYLNNIVEIKVFFQRIVSLKIIISLHTCNEIIIS